MSGSETAIELELELVAIRRADGKPLQDGHESRPRLPSVTSSRLSQGREINVRDGTPSGERTSSEPVPPGKLRSAGISITLASVSLLNTFNSGMLVVALPAMAQELNISEALLFWPASVYSLRLLCFLLLFRAIADLIGNRPVFLVGSLLYSVFTLAVSLARNGNQLIAFRALQGVAMAFCMPPAVSTITSTFPTGRTSNVAFVVFGGGNPVGFALGLVLGGVFAQFATWRAGYWMSTSVSAASMVLAWCVLPGRRDGEARLSMRDLRHRFLRESDWIGVRSASGCLALLSYVFAEITHGAGAMREKPYMIALLVVAVLLIPFFIFREGRQEKLGRPAILPNSIWRSREFTTVCISVFLTWAWFNAFGYWATLCFQVSQQLNALQAALRFMPMVATGLGTNVVAAMIIDRVHAGVIVLVGGVISAAAPLLFALQDLSWSYWVSAFPAIIIAVISTDLVFNVSSLIITTNFSGKSQALAGGVFNTVAQLGNSVGLAVTAMVSSAVTETAGHDTIATKSGLAYDSSLLQGYRSGFWLCFAAAVVGTLASSIGLHSAGKVGKKKTL
jgi:MFS family permease